MEAAHLRVLFPVDTCIHLALLAAFVQIEQKEPHPGLHVLRALLPRERVLDPRPGEPRQAPAADLRGAGGQPLLRLWRH